MNERIERVNINGLRHYRVTVDGELVGIFPSMTTILGETKDKSGLDEWRNNIGHAEADRISNLSMNRGTIMHRLIELYKGLKGTPTERLIELKDIALVDTEVNQFNNDPLGDVWLDAGWEFFMKFWNYHDEFFDRIEEVLAAEKFIWSKRGYAGTLDNASRTYDRGVLIIDYKNSRKPKRDEWISDYFIQVAGYSVAFYERTGIIPQGCEIWIASETEDKPQIFKMTYSDMKYYFKEFMQRLKQFQDKK